MTVSLQARIESGPDDDIEDADWDQVKRALARLDGATYSEVSIDRAPDVDGSQETLLVGGGNDDRLTVAYIRLADDLRRHWWFASDATRGEVLESRIVGGQGTPLPRHMWVDRSLVLTAASHFYHQGGRAAELTWVPDVVD